MHAMPCSTCIHIPECVLPPKVLYSKPMPDIESLMQVWDPQFEEMLANTSLPNPSLDVSLDEYVRVVCAIFDIPVYANSVESLHVLFTLFSEFKNNQHFASDVDQGFQNEAESPGFGGDFGGIGAGFGGDVGGGADVMTM